MDPNLLLLLFLELARTYNAIRAGETADPSAARPRPWGSAPAADRQAMADVLRQEADRLTADR